MKRGAGGDRHGVITSADLYCDDGRYLRLQQDWRQGLGWWAVGGDSGRQRLRVVDAIAMVSSSVGHEVLLEAERLVWMLQLDQDEGSGAGIDAEVTRLRSEVDEARVLYDGDRQVAGRRLSDVLLEVTQA